MDFFEHLNSEFAYSKQTFLYAIKKLPESKTIVIDIGMSSLSYNTGLLNIKYFKNFIKDVSELINANSKRNIIIIVSGSLEETRHKYLDKALTYYESRADSSDKTRQQNFSINNIPSRNSGFFSALVTLVYNDIVNTFCDGFANYNLRAIGFLISLVGTNSFVEQKKILKNIESIIFSNSKNSEIKISAVKDLLNKNVISAQNLDIKVKKTAETLKGLFRYFSRTIPIVMEDTSQKNNRLEEDGGFAAKIAVAIDADIVISISRKGMLYLTDPGTSDHPQPFYCYDTGRKDPFNDNRKRELAIKLNAAKYVNTYNKPIPFVLSPYNRPYTICNIFDKNTIDNIIQNGYYPQFTLFMNSNNPSLPIEARSASEKNAIIISDNAEDALINGKNSLLSIGIMKVEGNFEEKSIVIIKNHNLHNIGRGVVNFSSAEIINIISGERPIEDAKPKGGIIIDRTRMFLNK